MPLVDVARVPQVALAFQNEDHAEEARLLNLLADALEAHRAGRAGADAVLAPLDALVEHTREHFDREDRAMRESGFPAFPMHHAEHVHVLAQMADEAQAFREHGDAERLWVYVASVVPSWFVNHIQTMDAVTGRFVAARRGG